MALRKRPVLACGVHWAGQLKDTDLSVADLPAIVARLGLDGIEFREIYWKDKAAELPATSAAMRAHGLLPTYATFTTLISADPAARELLLSDIDDANALGSKRLRVFRGPWPEGADAPNMWAGARAAIDRAASYGMMLTLENFIGIPGNHRAEVEAALVELNSPILRTNIDTANYVQNGEDLIENIKALHQYIDYSHLKDLKKVDGQWQVVGLGEGDLPFDQIFELYDQTGRDFPVTFEFGGGADPERAIARSFEHLRSLGLPG